MPETDHDWAKGQFQHLKRKRTRTTVGCAHDSTATARTGHTRNPVKDDSWNPCSGLPACVGTIEPRSSVHTYPVGQWGPRISFRAATNDRPSTFTLHFTCHCTLLLFPVTLPQQGCSFTSCADNDRPDRVRLRCSATLGWAAGHREEMAARQAYEVEMHEQSSSCVNEFI